jgi:hypothetical protein
MGASVFLTANVIFTGFAVSIVTARPELRRIFSGGDDQALFLSSKDQRTANIAKSVYT